MKFVALLRGINVGKAKRIAMADLRAMLEESGYSGVRTLLNSGNAVFSAPSGAPASHAARIAAAIAGRFSLDVPVIVKSAADLDAMAKENRLAARVPDHSPLLTVFAQEPAQLQQLSAVAALAEPPEEWLAGKHAVYLHCANGILDSRAGEALLGKAGRGVTTRNWATVEKIRLLMAGTGE